MKKIQDSGIRQPIRQPKEKDRYKCRIYRGLKIKIVTPIGFEPMAASLENLCSIQLSYGVKKKLTSEF